MATYAERNVRVYAEQLLKASAADAALGVWLFASAFFFHHGYYAFFINNLFAGALATILAFGTFARAWMAWLPAGIGLWVALSPFVLRFTDNNAGMWNNILVGAAMVALAIRAWLISEEVEEAGMKPDIPVS